MGVFVKTRKLILVPMMVGLLMSGGAIAHGSYDRGERVTIASPQNRAVGESPFKVLFSASEVRIAPAGVDKHSAGHFHLMVDVDADPALDEPMQQTDQHMIFSAGERETLLDLPPGEHTLQLIVADEEHTHFEKLISEKITIDVKG